MNDLESVEIKVNKEQYLLYLVYKKGLNPENMQNVIIHFHGLGGRPKEEFTEVHKHFTSRKFMVISFNYPGCWKAPGLFVPEEIIECCIRIVEFIKEKFPEKNLFVYAEATHPHEAQQPKELDLNKIK